MEVHAYRSFSRITRSSPFRLAASHWGNGQAIQDHDTGARPRVVHVEVGEVPVPVDLAAALGVPVGAAVLSRSRRFAVDDRVVQTATSYIPLDVAAAAPAVANTGPGPGGIYARMADAGLKPEGFTERVICRIATPAEVVLLDLPGGVPVISITREARTSTGRCVEVNVMLLDANAYELTYAFSADG